jgi:integrase
VQAGHTKVALVILVDAPSAQPGEIQPLTLAEAQKITALAAARRNGTRWSVALALGLRQGEALGLCWRYIDLDTATLTVRWQLQRQRWQHGCADPRVLTGT